MNNKEMEGKQSTSLKGVCSSMLLDMVSMLATKKANSLCSCFMYEPRVPEKLKNN